MNEEINSYEYSYERDHQTSINSFAILGMIDLLQEVIESQPTMFAPMMYAEKTEEVKNDNGDVLYVNTTWKEHTSDSFFQTANTNDGGIPGLTPLSFKANQMMYALQMVHRQNIEKGEAKRIEELAKEEALNAL